MAVRITVDMWSGRPNPAVTLDEKQSMEVLDRLWPAAKLRDKGKPPLPILGYRGLVIEQVGRSRSRLPQTFRVAAGRVDGAGLAYRVQDPSFEDFVCGSSGPLRFVLPEPTLELLRRSVERLRHHHHHWPWPPHKHPHRHPCQCAPLYEPAWWNDGGARQFSNNCYNYASDYRTDTFAQPGLGSGAMYGSITDAEVRAAAIRDDLIYSPTANNKCPKEGHLVALVVGPFYDFHWYRKGRNGFWSHKPGGTEVTDRDNSGNLIPDPRTADRGPYVDFVSFMTVMHGHVKLR